MSAPSSFYRTIAPFPPYSRHLIHDIGAFQIGLGGCLAAGLVASDALLVALAGNTAGAMAHVASHVMDRGDGGHPNDPLTIGMVALVLAVLTVARWAVTRRAATPIGAGIAPDLPVGS
ncbi:MAG: hypothetical protein ACR2JQ_01130 [Mycobacteriales bacterium]